MWKRALVSVSDKTGLIEFLRPLVADGLEILSTGGTADYLKQNKFNVTDVSDFTGFPEILGGRVKTLHPKVHMGLLARMNLPEDQKILAEHQVPPIDLVVVNLYPFEEAYRQKKSLPELIEKIDVGGPTMLRAAAKNHQFVTVVSDPQFYPWVLENKIGWSQQKSQYLAAQTFSRLAAYDSLISEALKSADDKNFRYTNFSGELVQTLRYGENPHQSAGWYQTPHAGIHSAKILQGKELSYNNLLDLDSALRLVQLFKEPIAVAVKHNSACGAAMGTDFLRKTLQSDPVSVFGGIVVTNQKINVAEANSLSEVFLECVLAPKFTEAAVKILSAKKNLRLLEWPELTSVQDAFEIRSITGGFLKQAIDRDFVADGVAALNQWKIYGDKPNSAQLQDLLFAEKVCSQLKSNSIALISDGQTRGLGMGQVNRIDAVKHAIERWQQHHPKQNPAELILASDGFFPFADSIAEAAKVGIRWVLQPGGSVKDQEVIARSQELGVNLIMTGRRHFRH